MHSCFSARLWLDGCLAWRGLAWLQALTYIGGQMVLSSNMALASVQGLGALTTIGGDFIAKGNGVLMDLYPMTALTKVCVWCSPRMHARMHASDTAVAR